MPDKSLDEREFELVNIIGAQLVANQRALSRQMKLSLGMTNMLLKRLVTKGYIRIKQLDRRKVEYILTPTGFTEKMRKSVRYTIKTITSISLVKKRFKEILGVAYAQGERFFYVLGESDFAFLVEAVLHELEFKDYKVKYIENIAEVPSDGLLCICKEGFESIPEGQKHINFIKELAQDRELTTHNLLKEE